MQKTLLYLAILAILGFGVWYFLLSDRRVGEARFTINDTAAIGKIFIAPNSSEHTITLDRRAGGWIVNNEYPVLQSTLNQLLSTMRNQRTLYPVPDKQRDAVVRSLIGGGVKIEVYDREGRQMRAFYVGNEMTGFSGTAMLEVGAERPYVVQIPGFEGYLTTRYTADLAAWRDRIVFNLRPDDIASVQVTYPAHPSDNFTILNRDGRPEVRVDPSVQPATPMNERRVRTYLGFFHMLYNENYQSFRGLDSIIREMPEIGTVRVTDAGGKQQEVRFLYAPIDERSKNTDPVNPEEGVFNNERYYAIMNGGRDTATVQIQLFEKLFRKGPEFFGVDEKNGTDIPGTGR